VRWRSKKRDEDLEREIRSHLEAEADELQERGIRLKTLMRPPGAHSAT
jgi:hypothetical protein